MKDIVCPICMLDSFRLDERTGRYYCPCCGYIMGGGNIADDDDAYHYLAYDEDEDDEPHDKIRTGQSSSRGDESRLSRPEPYDARSASRHDHSAGTYDQRRQSSFC